MRADDRPAPPQAPPGYKLCRWGIERGQHGEPKWCRESTVGYAVSGTIFTVLFGVPAGTATAITIVERSITYAFSTALGGAALAAIGGWNVVRYRSNRT